MLANNRRVRFDGSTAEETFVRQLKADESSMAVLPMIDMSKMLLDAELRVAGEYKLTKGGGDDYFKVIAPGISQMSKFLHNSDRSGVADKAASSIVSRLINNLAMLRQDQLSGYKLIACNDRMEVDGCVSSKYVLVSNKSVYAVFRQSAEFLGSSVGMFTAELYRREMLAVLLSKAELVNGMHVGVLCQNAETAGRAIRVSMIYFDKQTRSWSADIFTPESRIRHVKRRQLFEKMMMAADSLQRRHKLAKKFAERLNASRKKRLPGDPKSKGWDDSLRSFLIKTAGDLPVAVERIDEVVDAVKRNQQCSWFDLYAACLKVADTRLLSGSISLRQLAKILIDRVD